MSASLPVVVGLLLVIQGLTKKLDIADPDRHLEGHLRALAEFAQSAPDAFEERSEMIIGFLLKYILPSSPSGVSWPSVASLVIFSCLWQDIDEEEEWDENEEVPLDSRLKNLALKICVNRCMAHTKRESSLDVTRPVIKMLFAILTNMGTVKQDQPDQ